MSSNTRPQPPLSVLLGLFILAGLLLRIVGLFFFPTGLEGDETGVIYWGRQFIRSQQWVLFHSEDLPVWETPAAYFFGGLDLMGINPRWGAVALSFVELGMCYLWTLRRSDKQTALLATAFLSLMPWHFFFSYVLGPCVAGVWTSLYLLDIKNPVGRIAANVGGLFYYASFRVILVWGGFVNIYRHRWRQWGFDLASGFVALTVLALLGGDHLKNFFLKGSYLVVQRGPLEWAHHYLNSILLWWLPPLQVWWQELSQYSSSDVGFAFANTLGYQTPLSIGTSLFFGWGLYLCFKEKKFRDILFLLLIAILLIGFSPSYVHFPFILPVVAFIAAVAANKALAMHAKNKILVIFSLMLSVVSIVIVISNFGTTDRWRVFTTKTELIPAVVLKHTEQKPFVWTAGADYMGARLAADRAGIAVSGFYTSLLTWTSDLTRQAYEKQTRWIFIQNDPEVLHPRPEVVKMMQESRSDYERRILFFEANVTVNSKKAVVVDGFELGTLYELAP